MVFLSSNTRGYDLRGTDDRGERPKHHTRGRKGILLHRTNKVHANVPVFLYATLNVEEKK